MAYFRSSSSSTSDRRGAFSDKDRFFAVPSNDALSGSDAEKNLYSEDREDGRSHRDGRPLLIFGLDISSLSPVIQYVILSSGLLFFMCLYGYFQELVIYGWFDRQLSIFSTFLHFAGCSIFAQLFRRISKGTASPLVLVDGHGEQHGSVPVLDDNSQEKEKERSNWLSLGTAPRHVAIGYYSLLVLLKTATQGLANMSMARINYPAKVLFKSANPIITMFIGITWFRKTYPRRDYIVVLLLVLGLYVFINGDAGASPQGTGLGIGLVTLSMFGAASVPMIQEHVMARYNAAVEDLLYIQYIGSMFVSFALSIFSGELLSGLSFLYNKGDVHTWIVFAAFCSFGFCGATFSTMITSRFGSLVNGITNTARKAVTLTLSFALFPERNTLTHQHIFGAAIFFMGLVVRVTNKGNMGVSAEKKQGADENV